MTTTSQYTSPKELFAAINDATGRFLAMSVDCCNYKTPRFSIVEIFNVGERSLDSRFGRPETFKPTPGKDFEVIDSNMTKREMMAYLKALWVGVSANAMVEAERGSNLIRETLPTDHVGSIGNPFVDVRIRIEVMETVRLSTMSTVTMQINASLFVRNWRNSESGRQHMESWSCGQQDAYAERCAAREEAIRDGITAVELMTDAITAAGWTPVGASGDATSEIVTHYGDALYMRRNWGDGFPDNALLCIHRDATDRARTALLRG
jgi:hypothetical protein